MGLIRLQPVLYLQTPLGEAEAHFYENPDGHEVHPLWHCFQLETNEPWVWPNPMVRIVESITGMRGRASTPFHFTEKYLKELMPHILRHTRSPLYPRAAKERKP